MIRFCRDPNGGPGFLMASPEDIRGMLRFVRTTLWNLNIHHDDAEDLAQNVEFITWKALEEKRIRKQPGQKAFNCLRSWMTETARHQGRNYKRRLRHRYELRIEADLAIEQDARLDARELLEKLTAYPAVLTLLFLLADGGMRKDGATAKGVYLKAYKARRWLRDVQESGVWREPPKYAKQTPKHRKKGR